MARTLIVSDRHNSFFSANNIRVGNQIPTEGSYVKGDIIVNTGNLSSDAMWICIESGNPGLWEVVGAGSGTTGGGSTVVSISDTVFVNEPVREVSLEGLDVIITSSDKLTVHHNSVHLMEGIDYKIEGNKIVKLTEGYWNEDSEEAMFAFELLKNVEQVDGSLVEVKTKLVCMQNTVTVQGAVREVLIGIEGFNKDNDTLMVFENETFLTRGVNYEINEAGNGIVPVGGEVWNDIMIDDWSYTFVVFKDVPLVEGEAKIGMGQLAEDVKEAIENASNIDLSGYVEQNAYDAKIAELEGKVNEAFTSANNGKQLIANAIGEPVSSDDTFSAMSNDINGLLSTFKTNMMNSGVMVESSDKFKSLIDKIATMVEEGSGKGIQLTSGEINSLSNNTYTTFDGLYSGYVYGSGWNRCNYIELSLNFTPTIILVQSTITTSGSSQFTIYSTTTYDNFSKNGIISKAEFTCSATANNDGSLLHFSPKIENGKYILPVRAYNTNYPIGTIQCTWLAIGVGEEDTTLRDSLASILQEEGVSVTNEDNMASLISKVDQEFDRQVVPQGNAGPGHVLQGVSFMNSSGTVQNGNIPILSSNYGTEQHYMTGEIQVGDYSGAGGQCLYFRIPRYWYTNVDWVMSYVPDLLPENIVSGKSICGVIGTAPKGYKFIAGTGATLYSGNVYSGSPGASQVIDIKGYEFWFNGAVKVSSFISDSGSTTTGSSIGSYTIELYNSSGTLKSSDKYDGLKNTTAVKDYTVSVGDYFRYKPDNRASYGAGIFRMNVIIQVSLTTV